MANAAISGTNSVVNKPPPRYGERHTLSPETELRLELSASTPATLTLLQGSAEVFGAELALDKPYNLRGNNKIAIFTWHGCVLDVELENDNKQLDISYTSDETVSNIAFVNTHAQLEALRDEAWNNNSNESENSSISINGPRVLLVGPADSGKSSLVRILLAYAVKLGRSPLLVDLDVSQNMLSVPGTITASPITSDACTPLSHASMGSSIDNSGTTPLVLFYGSTDPFSHPDLYRAQLTRLGQNIDARLEKDVEARASGVIINTGGWIEDVGYKILLHAAHALSVNVVLVMGHDRLYSMLTSHYGKLSTGDQKVKPPKVIKLPRSGGVVSRDASFRRTSRSLGIKKYFHGNLLSSPDGAVVNQYTPFLLEVPFSDLKLHKLSSVSLAASMLPVSAKQSTDPVQLLPIEMGPTLVHAILAVCHPQAVQEFEQSNQASDLYLSGIAGFVAVEKVDMDRDIVSLLSPCSGSLPSGTLLVGDITWME
eukprot:CAMPEP_0197834594 /NCGR_PEP_ID=MMETSP1437-20131217/22997_1 /TAXON_ID=49252 ORGANISM="Eucampia antarctica, Strain CCMP1452" /NCGR_SAMPLE_ID=MMETSP1437 /ASSEMBLY_ACC=CAM_ASM_001096 /LENGTH=483 /DNA_ID=CAMNT_0043439415 /DNA_START=48 /DNA_END=1499 /DNA_ORIENTATION=+